MVSVGGGNSMRWGRWIFIGATCLASGVAAVLYWKQYMKCNREKKALPRETSVKSTCDKHEEGLKCSREMKEQGNELFKKGLYQEAVEVFTEAIRLCPETEKEHLAICHQNRAATYDRFGNTTCSLADCNTAIDLDPCYTKAVVRRARAYLKTSMPEEALNDFSFAIVIDPASTESLKAEADAAVAFVTKKTIDHLKETRKSIPVRDESILFWRSTFVNDPVLIDLDRKLEEPTRPYEDALEALRTRNYESLCTKLEEDLQIPELSVADALKDYIFLGRICIFKEDIEALKKYLAEFDEKWQELDEDSKSIVEYKHMRGLYYLFVAALKMLLDKKNDFSKELQEAINVDGENPDIFLGAALLLSECSRVEEAIDYIDRVILTHPRKRLVRHMRANFELAWCAAESNIGGAIAAMGKVEQLLQEGDTDPIMYLVTGRLFYAALNKELAKDFFLKAAEGLPDYAAPVFYLAMMEAESMEGLPEQLPVLVAKMKICLQKEKNFPDALAVLAKVAYRTNNLDRAEELYSRCIDMCPLRTDEASVLPAVTDLVQIRALRKALTRLKAANGDE